MIFVTVGTHEQPFNRLVKSIDQWASGQDEEVIIQTGFSTYTPKHCKWSKLYPYTQMTELVGKARIVITHGGPSSFIMPLQIGKIPIVVPRQKQYDEHVNDHQLDFCHAVQKRYGNLIVVDDIHQLSDILQRYDEIVKNMDASMLNNNAVFNKKLSICVQELFRKK